MSRWKPICLATALASLLSPVASHAAAAERHQQGTVMHWTIDGVTILAPLARMTVSKRTVHSRSATRESGSDEGPCCSTTIDQPRSAMRRCAVP